MSVGLLCLWRGRLIWRGGRVCRGLALVGALVVGLGRRCGMLPLVRRRLWVLMDLGV